MRGEVEAAGVCGVVGVSSEFGERMGSWRSVFAGVYLHRFQVFDRPTARQRASDALTRRIKNPSLPKVLRKAISINELQVIDMSFRLWAVYPLW